MTTKKQLSSLQYDELLSALRQRFEKNGKRHDGLAWDDVKSRLDARPEAQLALFAMEASGGEPDVVGKDEKTGAYLFFDCSEESPKGRRSLCYDDNALQSRKEHKPRDSAENMASQMGIALLTENDYRALQQLGSFDTKTSSWIKTPDAIRKLGGAIFCDRRYDTVFLYHNGAESYYAARGFRGKISV